MNFRWSNVDAMSVVPDSSHVARDALAITDAALRQVLDD